jgi:hypothetical protein
MGRLATGGPALTYAVALSADLAEVLADIRSGGYSSLRGITTKLTIRGIKAKCGGAWSIGHVKMLPRRWPLPSQRKILRPARP